MKTVLVIDDDFTLRTVIQRALTQDGWTVLQAEDGIQGLEMAKTERPPLILLDLFMPRRNGFQFCREVKDNPELYGTPCLIVLTSSAYPNDRQTALESGAHACLLKPISLQALRDEIRKCSDTPGSLSSDPDACRLLPQVKPESLAVPHALGTPATVTFWGVRGSIPCPGPQTSIYGGNTSCLEIRADGELIILDAGTGIRLLGQKLSREFPNEALHATLLLSHTHWDHIQGMPFFAPAYQSKNQIRILGFEGARKGLQTALFSQMESPYFPITMKEMPSSIQIRELGDMEFKIGPIHVSAFFLNHPGVCVGYKISTSCGTIAYIPDNEPYQRLRLAEGDGADPEIKKFASEQDSKLIQFVKHADVLIIDSQYDDEEYQSHRGWGHGCLDDVVALAILARVKHLYLFHHDPDHDDDRLSSMVDWARQVASNQHAYLKIDAAREGLTHTLYASPSSTG